MRLTQIQHFLHKNPGGLTSRELARLCGAGIRTIQRDLIILQTDMNVPIIGKGKDRWGILKSYLLPPVSLSLYEAVILFLAARLIIRQTDDYNPHLQTALTRITSLLPSPMAIQLRRSVDSLRNKIRGITEDAKVFEQVAIAWGTQRRIKIAYQSLHSSQTKEWVVDPYFIEMTGVGYSIYVIGNATSAERRGITTFKLNRIKEIELLEDNYDIPEGLSMDELLSSSWGVIWGEEKELKLKFSSGVTRRVRETIWHPSQTIKETPDGGCILTMRVSSMLEITPWIRGWGPDVEVLEPDSLRQDFKRWAEQLHKMYELP